MKKKENERKFLIKAQMFLDLFGDKIVNKKFPIHYLGQYYTELSGTREVRYRKDMNLVDKTVVYYHTIKEDMLVDGSEFLERDETEEIMRGELFSKSIQDFIYYISKYRIKIKIDDIHAAEIDIIYSFGRRFVLFLAEVESDNKSKFEMPEWFGEEVTHDKRYKNKNLAKLISETEEDSLFTELGFRFVYELKIHRFQLMLSGMKLDCELSECQYPGKIDYFKSRHFNKSRRLITPDDTLLEEDISIPGGKEQIYPFSHTIQIDKSNLDPDPEMGTSRIVAVVGRGKDKILHHLLEGGIIELPKADGPEFDSFDGDDLTPVSYYDIDEDSINDHIKNGSKISYSLRGSGHVKVSTNDLIKSPSKDKEPNEETKREQSRQGFNFNKNRRKKKY